MTSYGRFRRRYISDNLIVAKETREQKPFQSGTGVIYLALGHEYMRLAVSSILSLRECGYSGPVRVVTDDIASHNKDLDFETLHVPCVGRSFRSRYYKTQINRYGFPITLYLDADTVPISSIAGIWQNLELADFCLCLQAARVQQFVDYYWKTDEGMRPELAYMQTVGLAGHAFYNSGVLLFRRNAATDALFEIWHQEWQRFGGHDQSALVRAIYQTRINVGTLHPHWNSRPATFQSIIDARRAGVKILHFLSGPQRDLLTKFGQR